MVTVLAALTVAAPAGAQDPVRDAYGGAGNVASEVATNHGAPGGRVADGVVSGAKAPVPGPATSATAARPRRGTELPFTGLDLKLVAGGGILLLALGFGVRRVSREPAT